jgi:hypothetical protein
MRLASGDEALVARVLTKDGKAGFGFSLALDAAEARHMAEWSAGARAVKPSLATRTGHPWEEAFVEGRPVPWERERHSRR